LDYRLKRRKVGNILLDIEPLLEELIEDHDLQWYDILFLIYGWLMMHMPGAREKYKDGTTPVFYYGHKDGLK
jgi:hypothetical protein